jgi:glucose/arabinose dehydrogenase
VSTYPATDVSRNPARKRDDRSNICSENHTRRIELHCGLIRMNLTEFTKALVLSLALSSSSFAQSQFADDYHPVPALPGQTRAPLADQSPRLIITEFNNEVDSPYGIAVLPDGRMLITEQPGRLRIIDSGGSLSAPIDGLPEVFQFRGNGLNDVTLDPDFKNNRLIYFVYTPPPNISTEGMEPDEISPLITGRVLRARLSDDEAKLEETEVILEARARRLVFGTDGTMYIPVAGAGPKRSLAQDLSAIEGKVLRINPDGTIPEDNPYVHRPGANPAVYSSGHRDPSGAAIHPGTGKLWTVEHGPRGGDELNIIEAGNDYGWPTISYGREYSQEPIGDGLTRAPGMEQPAYFWTPSIAPGSLLFYNGEKIAHWKGNAFVSTLSGEHLVRLVLNGDRVVAEERLLVGREQRIRTVAQGSDGDLYLAVTGLGGGGQLLRITQKPPPNMFGDLE